jgi:hypothetical protein
LDAAEPPQIVFENTASCDHTHQAEMDLKEALSRARAPAPGWLVKVRIHNSGANGVQADGDISDESGAPLGHREFTGKASDCDGLARAVVVWASLVLDAEMRRPRTADAAGEEAAKNAEGGAKADTRVARIHKPKDSLPDLPWLPPDDTPSREDEPATQEIGAGTFVMSGIGGHPYVGGTPFLVIAATNSFLFRPAVALGESIEGPSSTWVALRLDGCFRLMGQYASQRGLQMSLCGGVDVGVIDGLGLELPFISPGPSIDLGGELASALSLVVRGIGGVNAARDSRLDTPFAWARGELDLSWRLR